MNTSAQLLDGKNVLVFAATGSIGSATARHLADAGAHVWLSGRNRPALDDVANAIVTSGGQASVDVVDAIDESQVAEYFGKVAATASVDGVFNAIGATPKELGYPSVSESLDLETFLKPVRLILGSTFLTSRIAARHMRAQGSGSIVTLSASITGSPVPWMAALTATCGAIEFLTRSLATELAPFGIRVNCVRADAMPDSRTIPLTTAGMADIAASFGIDLAAQLSGPPLGRPVSVNDTAQTVAFLLSDASRATSSQVINVASRAMVG